MKLFLNYKNPYFRLFNTIIVSDRLKYIIFIFLIFSYIENIRIIKLDFFRAMCQKILAPVTGSGVWVLGTHTHDAHDQIPSLHACKQVQ